MTICMGGMESAAYSQNAIRKRQRDGVNERETEKWNMRMKGQKQTESAILAVYLTTGNACSFLIKCVLHLNFFLFYFICVPEDFMEANT